MVLTTCPECGHRVSTSAPYCPGCGRAIGARPQREGCFLQTLNLGCGCVLLFALFVLLWIAIR